ncbi:MBL fold metallo-hydrolase, partial [Chloroflexota bacterium]
PGHTGGSISVVMPGEVVLVGDMVIGKYAITRRPARPLFYEDIQQIRKSVGRLLDYSPRLFLSGHGGPLKAEDVGRAILR